MSSPGSREAILTAQDNVERHLQYCNRQGSSEPGETRRISPSWVQDIDNGNMDLIIQYHDHPGFRGAANTMARLIQVHGIKNLQNVGIVGQGSASHKQEMALAAGVYNIPVRSQASSENKLSGITLADPRPLLDFGRLEINTLPSTAPGCSATTCPIPFPSNEDIDAVHGQGTLAFQLERELSERSQSTTNKSRPDIVLSDLDNGITLSGICAAFAGTGTHVFGAAPQSGFWDHAWNIDLPSAALTGDDHGRKYWADIKHPMPAITWSTFTAPGYLSGIFEVTNEEIHAAVSIARLHFQLDLEPGEVVPLAVALYNQEFRNFASQRVKEDRKRVVGVISRSRKH